jgi:hypothetical protein
LRFDCHSTYHVLCCIEFDSRLNISYLILPSLKSKLRVEVIHLVPVGRKPVSDCAPGREQGMGNVRNEIHFQNIRMQFRKAGSDRLEENVPNNLRSTMSITVDHDSVRMSTLWPGAARCNPSEYMCSNAASSRDPAAAQTASQAFTTGTPSFSSICSTASTYCFICSLDLSIFLGGV